MRERFLVATDLSEGSLPALRAALRLAAATGASVVVLHVVETPGERTPGLAPFLKTAAKAYRKVLAGQIEDAKRRLGRQLEFEEEAGAPDVRGVVVPGNVSETVLATARSLQASLVVLGKGRRVGALGHMAERIARLARRPVLIVPGKAASGIPRRVAVPLPVRRRAPRALRAASR